MVGLMGVSGALVAGRAAAESLMLDEGQAQRPTGGLTYDPVTQSEVPAMDPDFGFSSRCKVQSRAVIVRTEEVGERTAATIRLELQLPVDTAPLQVGDVFTVTTPHPLSTVPAGTAYRVNGPAEGSLKTARRYEVERIVS
jgi:hypothetical protein